MRNTVTKGLFSTLLLLLALGLSLPAAALSLQQAKAKGLVGETTGGYLAPVGAASGEVQALVTNVNRQRKARYQAIASRNGTSLAAVEKLAGQKAIELTAPGNYVRTPSGQWRKK